MIKPQQSGFLDSATLPVKTGISLRSESILV